MANLIDDVKKAFNVAKDKTTDFVDKTQTKVKLNIEIGEKEKALKDIYLELGKKYCEMYKDTNDESISKAVKLENEIKDLKAKLDEVK